MVKLKNHYFQFFQNIFFFNSLKNSSGGFQFLLILDLWGINFQAVVVFGLGKNLLFKSVLGHCELHSSLNSNSTQF